MASQTKKEVTRLHRMLDSQTETHPGILEQIEDIKDALISQDSADELEKLVEKYSARYPKEYATEYEWLEKKLISYYLFRGNADGVKRRLRWPREFPVEGVDVVTMRVLYQLLYFGLYPEALEFAREVWRPLEASPKIWGEPHMEFCMTIMLDNLEKAWDRAKAGEQVDWEGFARSMEGYRIDPDEINFGAILDALQRPFDLTEVTTMIGREERSRWILFLGEHFRVFMKERFGIPFILSDNWWLIMYSEKLLRKGEDPGEIFNVGLKRFDRAFSELCDFAFKSNDIEIIGKVFGMKYIYYFLHETGLIHEKVYRKMKNRIAALELMFERVAREELWTMTFVFNWPQLDPEDEERRTVYESTFPGDEDGILPVFDAYLERRLEQFNEKTRARIESDVMDF